MKVVYLYTFNRKILTMQRLINRNPFSKQNEINKQSIPTYKLKVIHSDNSITVFIHIKKTQQKVITNWRINIKHCYNNKMIPHFTTTYHVRLATGLHTRVASKVGSKVHIDDK